MDQKKQKALEALLDSRTLTEAAQKAGISRRTLYTYIRTDLKFATAYQAAQEQSVIDQLEAISDEKSRAKAVILSLMEDEEQPAAVRLKAAQSILDTADALQKASASIASAKVADNRSIFDI